MVMEIEVILELELEMKIPVLMYGKCLVMIITGMRCIYCNSNCRFILVWYLDCWRSMSFYFYFIFLLPIYFLFRINGILSCFRTS
jgi:hypothetical protein